MKLKEKVKLLMDGDIVKEVKGSEVFNIPGVVYDFFVHASESPWRQGRADISEKSTGLRVCATEIDVDKILIENAIIEVKRCISLHSIEKMALKIDSTKKLQEREDAQQ